VETKKQGPGGVGKLAKILAHMDPDSGKRILETLGKQSPPVADSLRERLVTFDDLALLDDRTIQAAVHHLDMRVLALALRGAPDGLLERILRNMSQRAAEMLRSDIDAVGPQPRAKVNQARHEIMRCLRALEGAGRISLVRPGDQLIE
jgi:flagellar motor switch protein FliG